MNPVNEMIFEAYREITGLDKIPRGKGFWTVCGKQPDTKKAKIAQLVKLGLITKMQFYGVDKNETFIRLNKNFHPQANWVLGEWIDVVSDKQFNPGMVHLPMARFRNRNVIGEIVARTMLRCPKGCILAVDVMKNKKGTKRREEERDDLVEQLQCRVPSLELWDSKIHTFECNIGNMVLQMFVFHKLAAESSSGILVT